MSDPLKDIRHFSPTMTISQVLLFFERQGMDITRAMIQNYIRDGLLPSPINKRQYTHKHLAAMAMITRLKTVFDMQTIQEAMEPHMDADGLPIDVYSTMMEKLGGMIGKWGADVAPTLAAETDGGTLLSMAFATELKSVIVDRG